MTPAPTSDEPLGLADPSPRRILRVPKIVGALASGYARLAGAKEPSATDDGAAEPAAYPSRQPALPARACARHRSVQPGSGEMASESAGREEVWA
jgi:hypothetical protein